MVSLIMRVIDWIRVISTYGASEVVGHSGSRLPTADVEDDLLHLVACFDRTTRNERHVRAELSHGNPHVVPHAGLEIDAFQVDTNLTSR